MPAVSQVKYTWGDIEQAVQQTHWSMQAHGYMPRRIVGIARGGMIPAVMLAHKFGIDKIDTIRIQSYTRMQQEELRILGVLNAAQWDLPQCLVVDDLWDSGKTMTYIQKQLPEATTCTLFYKGERPSVSWPGISVPNEWIVFPWEV